MLSPVRTVAPTLPFITVDEVKESLHIRHDDSDQYLSRLCDSATEMLDGWSGILGRCLVSQTWRQDLAGFPAGDDLCLPMPGVQSVTIAYYDADGVSQTYAASSWSLHETSKGASVILADGSSWPGTDDRPDAVQLTMVCGYGDAASAAPEPLRNAAIIMVESLYMGEDPVSRAVSQLVAPFRRVRI